MERFIKVTLSYWDILALTNYGNLYHYNLETQDYYLFQSDIRDFDLGEGGIPNNEVYFLQNSGFVYMAGAALAESPKAIGISSKVLTMSDGKVKCFAEDLVNSRTLELEAQDVVSSNGLVFVRDSDNTLWRYSAANKVLEKIADEVIAFDYSNSSKTFNSSDVWYITEDRQLAVNESFVRDEITYTSLPDNVISVSGSHGNYLAQRVTGDYTLGSFYSDNTIIPTIGTGADLLDDSYIIIGTDGVLYCHINFEWYIDRGGQSDFSIALP